MRLKIFIVDQEVGQNFTFRPVPHIVLMMGFFMRSGREKDAQGQERVWEKKSTR